MSIEDEMKKLRDIARGEKTVENVAQLRAMLDFITKEMNKPSRAETWASAALSGFHNLVKLLPEEKQKDADILVKSALALLNLSHVETALTFIGLAVTFGEKNNIDKTASIEMAVGLIANSAVVEGEHAQRYLLDGREAMKRMFPHLRVMFEMIEVLIKKAKEP